MEEINKDLLELPILSTDGCDVTNLAVTHGHDFSNLCVGEMDASQITSDTPYSDK